MPGLLALLIVDGLLLGASASCSRRCTPGAVPTPVGALLSILVLPWLVLHAGELDPRPGLAGAPLIAWLAAVAVLGVGGSGGDVLLPATWQSAASGVRWAVAGQGLWGAAGGVDGR